MTESQERANKAKWACDFCGEHGFPIDHGCLPINLKKRIEELEREAVEWSKQKWIDIKKIEELEKERVRLQEEINIRDLNLFEDDNSIRELEQKLVQATKEKRKEANKFMDEIELPRGSKLQKGIESLCRKVRNEALEEAAKILKNPNWKSSKPFYKEILDLKEDKK